MSFPNFISRILGLCLFFSMMVSCTGHWERIYKSQLPLPFKNACGGPWLGAINPGPDRAPTPEERKRKTPEETYKAMAIERDRPTDHIWFLGTNGVVTQPMHAEPTSELCPLGAQVELSRNHDNDDSKCCPPGLTFKNYGSLVIEGIPRIPGHFTTTILVCARCKEASESNYQTIRGSRMYPTIRGFNTRKARREGTLYPKFPIPVKVEWKIEGKAPSRLE